MKFRIEYLSLEADPGCRKNTDDYKSAAESALESAAANIDHLLTAVVNGFRDVMSTGDDTDDFRIALETTLADMVRAEAQHQHPGPVGDFAEWTDEQWAIWRLNPTFTVSVAA